jgi:hypothetical protein
MKILILGCGPAGLFAAHAANQLGHSVDILSKRRKSEMFGAQYLHRDIPGLTDLDDVARRVARFEVTYTLTGTLDEYLHKVYGDEIPDNVTVDSLEKKESAWDIRATYLNAWMRYFHLIEEVDLNSRRLAEEIDRRKPHIVISTVPAPSLCYRRGIHSFISRDIWAVGDAPERGIFAPSWAPGTNIIAYDGTAHRGWYRASNIAGYNAVEWPEQSKPPLPTVARVVKPIRTDCNCFIERGDPRQRHPIYWRVGRYGSWSRFGHTHQAYWRISEALKGIQR